MLSGMGSRSGWESAYRSVAARSRWQSKMTESAARGLAKRSGAGHTHHGASRRDDRGRNCVGTKSNRGHACALLVSIAGQFCGRKVMINKARKRIFLVDDHPLVREWLTNLINQQADLAVC